MKGIIFNLLEEVVVSEYGEDVWDVLLTKAGVDGIHTSLGSYPDADMGKLVQAAASELNLPAFEILRWFGRKAMPLLFSRYPVFFTRHQETRPFLLSLNDIIHPEVRKVYPGAQVPTFEFTETADGGLDIGYNSARRLCGLAEGFIGGAAMHYAQTVAIVQSECMNRGDSRCLLQVRFSEGRAATPRL